MIARRQFKLNGFRQIKPPRHRLSGSSGQEELALSNTVSFHSNAGTR